jgi:hypothetical protein
MVQCGKFFGAILTPSPAPTTGIRPKKGIHALARQLHCMGNAKNSTRKEIHAKIFILESRAHAYPAGFILLF